MPPQVAQLLGALQPEQAYQATPMGQFGIVGIVEQLDVNAFTAIGQRRVGFDFDPRLARAPGLGKIVHFPARKTGGQWVRR